MPHTKYIWDPLSDNVLMEKDENGYTKATSTYLPELYGDLVSQRRGGKTSYHHFDGQGSTRALTDESENVTDTYTYTAFGEEVSKAGTTENPYRYVGEKGYLWDEETKTYYIRSRSLQPALSQWLSRDPMGLSYGVNVYRYVDNCPTAFIDPSGLRIDTYDGTRGCWGKPLDGQVQYVTGRGQFGIVSNLSAGRPTEVSAGASASWYPEAVNFSHKQSWEPGTHGLQPRDCVQNCCDELGVVQIVQVDIKRSGWPDTRQGFTVDDADSTFFYAHSTRGVDPVTGRRLLFEDEAGTSFKSWTLFGGFRVIRFRFQAHTCVVCRSGNEGPHTSDAFGRTERAHLYPVAIPNTVEYRGVTVYGCIEWGFDIKARNSWPRNDKEYDYRRWIGPEAIDGDKSDGIYITSGVSNSAPPAEFEHAVIGFQAKYYKPDQLPGNF